MRASYRLHTRIQGPEAEAERAAVGQARSRLGAATFDALMRQGSEMSYDEISTYVIGTMDRLVAAQLES
jgi:hypothetical protein